MTLQRRLLLYLLVCAPLVWAGAMAVSVAYANYEVNELYDTEMVRLARSLQARTWPQAPGEAAGGAPSGVDSRGDQGQADFDDLAVAVWDANGQRLESDADGLQLPFRAAARGFVELPFDGAPWRVYYLDEPARGVQVAVGQRTGERREMVLTLAGSQIVPWLLTLPVLMGVMAWAVRRALAPVRELTDTLGQRSAEALDPVPGDRVPAELQPMVGAMNALFVRIGETLARERRFVADAAHELRTPLAVLRAQWDVLRLSTRADERAAAQARLGVGIERLDRLVTQLLALSRLEDAAGPSSAALPIDWPNTLAQALDDCLPLAERRRIELACDWPNDGRPPLPLRGDPHLLQVLLRNLIDNAVRYAPPDSTVQMRFGPTQFEIDNDGPPIDATLLARLGERFYRPDGQDESGSGLGLSIVRRIALLHGLRLVLATGASGGGLHACVQAIDAHEAAGKP